ncbi:hypothetical protein [Rodentibacter caecimuris]|uniref:hypothetical protein n=1 Tax=Rodentibacter caecimuris TaxID=1796644 RepID=UPI002589D05E|nr:hypothetical protein [Rodentibacter heylii]
MAKIEVVVTEYWSTSLDEVTRKPFRVGYVRAGNRSQQNEVNQAMELMAKSNSRILYPAPINIEALRKTENRKILNTETLQFEELKNA